MRVAFRRAVLVTVLIGAGGASASGPSGAPTATEVGPDDVLDLLELFDRGPHAARAGSCRMIDDGDVPGPCAGPDRPEASRPKGVDDPEAGEPWELSLRDAIRIGLENAEAVRVLSVGGRGTVVIARADREMNAWRFKAEVMAHVRSIEQQYWSLAQQRAQLASAEKAVGLAEQIIKREQSELEVSRGTVADPVEMQQRLEQFRLDRVAKASDVMTTERQLRNILGLPPVDARRIVPTTPPCEARLEPGWDACLAAMLVSQPDIILQREAERAAERHLQFARSPHNRGGVNPLAMEPGPIPSRREPLANARQAKYTLLKQRAYLQQVVRQTTHSLARFFLEIDANDKQFRTASRLRELAAQRLEAQRGFYDEGRITAERYLDAVGQYAAAEAQEAQFRTAYNVSIVALEEAKGTLLVYDNIATDDEPIPPAAPARGVLAAIEETSGDRMRWLAAADRDVVRAGLETAQDRAPEATETATPAPAPPTTIEFDIAIGRSEPIRIRGSVTIGRGGPAAPRD
jgi:hypothetical protein